MRWIEIFKTVEWNKITKYGLFSQKNLTNSCRKKLWKIYLSARKRKLNNFISLEILYNEKVFIVVKNKRTETKSQTKVASKHFFGSWIQKIVEKYDMWNQSFRVVTLPNWGLNSLKKTWSYTHSVTSQITFLILAVDYLHG